MEVNMNEQFKEKLMSRAVYTIIALLMLTVITLTVVGITSTVSKRNELPVDTLPEDNVAELPSGAAPTEKPSEDNTETDKEASVTPPEEEVKAVYVSPCDGGYIQKGHDDSVLVFSSTMNEYRLHLGVDISGKIGDPVRAFSDGTVEKIYKDYFMGKTVVISHGNGLKSYYMNLAETLPEGIEVGKKVSYGTVIGAIGETANLECADSPHLHFEIFLGDKPINPKEYVTLPEKPTISEDFDE